MLIQPEWAKGIGHFVAEHPEVSLALLVPPAHFLWNRYNMRNYKRSLRNEIAELLEHRESLSKLPALAQAQRILQDIEADLRQAMDELLTAGARHDLYRKLSFRPSLARGLLLYKPPGFAAWIVHVLFFFNMAMVLFGTLDALLAWDRDSAAVLLGVAILLIPAYFLESLARRIARKHSTTPQAAAPALASPVPNS